MDKLLHQPIMVSEVLQALKIDPDGIYIDATFGRGGHTSAILSAVKSTARVYGLDKDPAAIAAGQLLSKNHPQFSIHHTSFANIQDFCNHHALLGKVSGILLDLGVSSPQLDDAARGFSFRHNGPLDMRMNPTQGMSAAIWINQAPEAEIIEILKVYGEERYAKRIGKAIYAAIRIKPLTTTDELSAIVSKAHPAWEKHKHPATRSFQAIRIFINQELQELQQGLEGCLEILKPGGRMAILSFHSLEDRIVKRFIQKHTQKDKHAVGLPIANAHFTSRLSKIGKKITPSLEEIRDNPRARSAVMRVAQKE